MATQHEQVVTLVQGQVQPPGERGQHLLRRVRPALLLDPTVVVDLRGRGQSGAHLL